MTVCELIAALAHLPPDHPVHLYPGHDAGEIVVAEVLECSHKSDRPIVVLMERPFDKGDPLTLWREWFQAGRARPLTGLTQRIYLPRAPRRVSTRQQPRCISVSAAMVWRSKSRRSIGVAC